jgi:hypothetical protein
MLVITGMFENERFIPDKPISIPQNKKVTVTIDDELPITAQRRAIRQSAFDKCRLDMSDFKFNRDEANE